MYTPTHIVVTVQRAKGLLYKGKNGTNDCYVTIACGKEKYQTSVKERASDPVEWHEECELPIPKQGNKAEIVLTALHRNFVADEFLGQISIPLSDFDVYEKPKNKWYTLKSKPGKEKKKERGDLEVRIGFTVKAVANAGSLSDLSKKEGLRSSLTSLRTSVGGSLLSLRSKEKKGSLKNLAKAVGSKVSTLPGRGKKKPKDDVFGAIPEHENGFISGKQQRHGEADPGVISDDEDEFRFDELSHKSSHSSLSVSQIALSTPKDGGSLENLGGGEFLRRNYNTPPRGKTITVPENNNRSSWNSGPPLDEWDAKLFGKQQQNNVETNNALNYSPSTNRKEVEPEPEPEVIESKPEEVPKPETKEGDGIKALLFATSSIFLQDKEPVPKPRTIHQEVKEESKKSVLPDNENSTTTTTTVKEVSDDKKSKDKEKPKEKEKEKTKNGPKETFASIFTPHKSKHEHEEPQPKPPVGITNPIQKSQNDEPKRIPRELLRKFEGRSREDLIEMVLNLQTTVDCQKQKIVDMESYIDDLLVRVLENQPTLLQQPFGGCGTTIRPLKSKKWSF